MMSSPEAKESALPWWRQRWVSLTAIVMAVQVFAFRSVAPESLRRRRPSVERFDAFVTPSLGNSDGAALEAWCWLMTPAVFLLPAAEDFSGLAWLQGEAGGLAAEVFELPLRPLPWGGPEVGYPRGLGLPRVEAGMAERWRDSWDAVGLPAAVPVPVARASRIRVVAGLEGRPIVRGLESALVPEAKVAAARPVVVRVTVDASGELAEPPVVWEASDLAAADEAALSWVRGLGFAPSRGGGGVERETGLVVVEWGLPGEGLSLPGVGASERGGG